VFVKSIFLCIDELWSMVILIIPVLVILIRPELVHLYITNLVHYLPVVIMVVILLWT